MTESCFGLRPFCVKPSNLILKISSLTTPYRKGMRSSRGSPLRLWLCARQVHLLPNLTFFYVRQEVTAEAEEAI